MRKQADEDWTYFYGMWVNAIEEPYYPTLWESFLHKFGKHFYYSILSNTCLICGRKK
jgi:hypothetical protein